MGERKGREEDKNQEDKVEQVTTPHLLDNAYQLT